MDEKSISREERIGLILELLGLYNEIDKEKAREVRQENIPVVQKIESAPDIEGCYDVKDLERILNISRPAVYELLKKNEFPVKRLGTNYRIPKETFNEWCRKIEED